LGWANFHEVKLFASDGQHAQAPGIKLGSSHSGRWSLAAKALATGDINNVSKDIRDASRVYRYR